MKRILIIVPIARETEARTAARASYARAVPANHNLFFGRYSPNGAEPASHLAACGPVDDADATAFARAVAARPDIRVLDWDDERDEQFAQRTFTTLGLMKVIPAQATNESIK